MDTHNNFTYHLYAALQRSGIFTFRDNERLESGKSISPELLKAIEESRISIVILSKNYASSTWCLDELAKIIQRMKVMGMIVLPIFYNVDPSDVHKQIGTFAQAFAEHEERLKDNMEKVQTWRATLSEVANLSGWHSQDRPEAEVIEDVVKVILNKLSYTLFIDTKEQVGMTSRVEKIMSHLAIESNGVRLIGIKGIGGMGKTALARIVYKMISNQFEECSFISNVREVYEKYGILQLKQTLLNDLLILRDIKVKDVNDGVFMIKNRLRHEKILLVLDDENELDQLNKLVAKHDCSKYIKSKSLEPNIDDIYKAEGLSNEEALYLFNSKAFDEEHPPEDYLELCQAFINYANGLPLAIEGTEAIQGIVLTLPKLKQAHWDPSSFSKMHRLKFLIIENCHLMYDPKHLPNDLRFLDCGGYTSKSLPASFQPNELIELHMCYNNIERLWKGTKSCEMLKFIELKGSLTLFETPDFIEISSLEKLVLEDCTNLREIHPSIGVHKKLTLLNLKGCKNLKSLPRKFEIESLEILILSNCLKIKTIAKFGENMGRVTKLYLDGTAITKLPTSVGNLSGLDSLNVWDCKNLMSLPSTFFNMMWLKDLNLSGYSKLEENLGRGESVKGLCLTYEDDIYTMLFPGSEILEWFSHQCMGHEVNIMEPFSHLCNDGIGIAFCIVFCTLPSHPIQYYSPISCELKINGKYFNYVSGELVALSNHIMLLYFLPQLWECDANGFCEIGIKIEDTPTSLVKKCGLRVVYKKDIEDLNSAMAHCSNNGIIPYKGFDVPHHNFNNSAVVVEVNKNDCEESSQYKECGETLSNWQELHVTNNSKT
ncbi:TMV resistance protein N-like [Quercus lobata]|uniref:TMV resistance protein N-like n=1 Tax=Quercus lobata TaxID=97700 RepID=UPI001245E03D|nr:TMV resistance protein N-like [Quercus lobata]